MKCLSQKLRTKRFHRKRKSLSVDGSTGVPKVAKSAHLADVSLTTPDKATLTEAEYETHLAELERLAEVKQPKMSHVKTLLTETFEYRRVWLKSLNVSSFFLNFLGVCRYCDIIISVVSWCMFICTQ